MIRLISMFVFMSSAVVRKETFFSSQLANVTMVINQLEKVSLMR